MYFGWLPHLKKILVRSKTVANRLFSLMHVVWIRLLEHLGQVNCETILHFEQRNMNCGTCTLK